MRSKKANVVIALLAAIALWVYVAGETNPETKKTFRSIPIKYQNSQTLTDNNLALMSYSDTELSITVTGRRSEIGKITENDITATVDLAKAYAGPNTLSIDVTTPDGVEISRQSIRDVQVEVEKLISARKEIRVSYLGEFSDDSEPTTVSTDPDAITVSGAESLVEDVEYVRATVEGGALGDEEMVTTSKLVAVDQSGKEVENVTLSQKTATIVSVLYITKSVPLNLTITGESDEDFERTYEDPPSMITVKGPITALGETEQIEAYSIDISGLEEDTAIPIEPILPEGVVLTKAFENMQLVVKVKPIPKDNEKKLLVFGAEEITVEDLDPLLEAQINAGDITVELTGTKEQIDAIEKEDIVMVIRLGGLEVGTHTVDLEVSTGKPNNPFNRAVLPLPGTARLFHLPGFARPFRFSLAFCSAL